MNHNGLLQWIYAHILDEQMNSDPRQLALELRMTEKTIDSALHKEGSAEYTLLFEQLLSLCAKKQISVDQILRKYFSANR
ncbi:MAG: hypothetical protein IJ089_00950 [Clostridia bacterium]|jgi:hypothetical protein|nr:hypothetical protein [Clostridia bacterium]